MAGMLTQFEYNYKEIIPQRLQKMSSNNELFITARPNSKIRNVLTSSNCVELEEFYSFCIIVYTIGGNCSHYYRS